MSLTLANLLIVIVVLVALGIGLQLLNSKVSMHPTLKKAVNWIVIGGGILWALYRLGVLNFLQSNI